MKKITICLLFIFFISGSIYSCGDTQKFLSSKFNFFINIGFLSEPNIPDINYNFRSITGDFMDINENGTISHNQSTIAGFSAGFNHYFLEYLGISFSINYNIPKNTNIRSTYNYSDQYFRTESGPAHKNWITPGSIHVIPVACSLVCRIQTSQKNFLNFRAGVAVFFTKLDSRSHMGWGVMYVGGEYIPWPDWYDLELSIKNSGTSLGGNLGADFEYKINNRFGLFAGLDYFYCPAKEYNWELVPVQKYVGEIYSWIYKFTPDISRVIEPIRIDFTFLKAFIGIKIYLQ